jgi:hypothetical protein
MVVNVVDLGGEVPYLQFSDGSLYVDKSWYEQYETFRLLFE